MNLNTIKGSVNVQGGGATELDIDDQNSAGRPVQLDATSLLAGLVVAPIFFHNLANLAPNAGASASVDARGTAANTSVRVNLATGTNKVNIGSAGNTLDAIQGILLVNGQTGTDPLVLDDQNGPPMLSYFINPFSIASSLSAAIQFQNMGRVTLNGDLGDAFYQVNGVPSATPVTLHGASPFPNFLLVPHHTTLSTTPRPTPRTPTNTSPSHPLT